MNYNNPIPEKTVGIIRYACGFLFVGFCFCFLFFLQGDALAEAQHVLSNGLTKYSLLIGAVIITAVLQLLQFVVSLLIRMPNRYYILTYVPSFICLAMLSDINQNVNGNFIWGIWTWLFPVLLVAWVIAMFVAKKVEKREESISSSLQSLAWPNFLIMLMMICACGMVPPESDVKMYELKVERLLSDKDYENAAAVGIRSLNATERLTRMRMFALAKQGLLADSMFSYPQYYGTKGLINIDDTATSVRFSMSDIEFSLGAFAGKTIKSSKRYLELLTADSIATEQSKQYLLCYYLLDKDLKSFNTKLNEVYGDTIEVELPRAYQEAIIMQHPEFTPDSVPIYINKVYVENYASFMVLQDSIKDKRERKNRTRREYGCTYWNYYLNN